MRKDIFEVLYMEKKENGKINYSKIAKQYNCDPRTVKRYYNERDSNPTIRKPRIIIKVIQGFEEIIEKKYVESGAPAIAIYNFLKERYGYKGSYTSIKTFTHNLKEKLINDITVRFETSPGLQCQVDWKENMLLHDKKGREYIINIFLSILGYSRLKYIELTLDKMQPTLFKCITNAIKYFGGTPKEFLFDNMRTVVDHSRTQFNKPVYNEKFYSFAKDAGFIPKSCLAYKPRTKGKVEVVAKIMDRLKVYDYEFSNLDELNNIINDLRDSINNEVQSTTKEKPIERFQKEKEYLNCEPNYEILEAYFASRPMIRIVPKDSLITYQNKRYSVPPKYIGKQVTIEAKDNLLYIYYNKNLICSHQISEKKISYNKEHYKELLIHSSLDKNSIDNVCQTNLDLLDKL
ncbi:IS21 family transposase [bacterium]|nr:IS21 family transposase [bacterium]